MTALAIMCGLPRSGKTTIAKTFPGEYARICPDDIRLALHGAAFIGRAEPFVWATAEIMARAFLLGGQDVLIDATNATIDRRATWERLAREFGIPLAIWWVATPIDVCLERGDGVFPAAVLRRMAASFEPPTDDEGVVHQAVQDVSGEFAGWRLL